MDCLQNIKDSVETSLTLKLFSSIKKSSYYHIFNSKFFMFPISMCEELNNFNPARLSKDPYPETNRPRGQKNLNSLNYHKKRIRTQGQTEPIWIGLKNGEYFLLDGAHRIVASYLENKEKIPSFIVNIDAVNSEV
jgi:hypothetical protein